MKRAAEWAALFHRSVDGGSGGAGVDRAAGIEPVPNPDLHQAIAQQPNEYSLN